MPLSLENLPNYLLKWNPRSGVPTRKLQSEIHIKRSQKLFELTTAAIKALIQPELHPAKIQKTISADINQFTAHII